MLGLSPIGETSQNGRVLVVSLLQSCEVPLHPLSQEFPPSKAPHACGPPFSRNLRLSSTLWNCAGRIRTATEKHEQSQQKNTLHFKPSRGCLSQDPRIKHSLWIFVYGQIHFALDGRSPIRILHGYPGIQQLVRRSGFVYVQYLGVR